jgi:hypothetical protein
MYVCMYVCTYARMYVYTFYKYYQYRVVPPQAISWYIIPISTSMGYWASRQRI